MNIIQGMHLSRMRIVLIAVVLAIAGLLVSASQIGPAGAATAHAARRRAQAHCRARTRRVG